MPSYGEGFAGGMNSGMNLANNILRIKDEAEKKKATGALFDQADKEGQTLINNDLSNYDNQRASLFEGGYQPSQDETKALNEGYQNLQSQKPSDVFMSSIMGMSNQERLGHMVQLAQQGGLKMNGNTIEALQGVNSLFDGVKQADTQEEQKAYAFQALKDKEAEDNANKEALGRATYNLFGKDDKYKGMFGEGEPTSYSQYATLAPLLFKDSASNDKIESLILMNALNNKTKQDIADQSDETRRTLAPLIHSQNSNNDYWREQSLEQRKREQQYKQEQDKKEEDRKTQENKQKQYDERRKTATKQLSEDKTFKKLDANQQEQVIDYYAKYGVMPKREVKESGLLFKDKKTVFNTTPPSSSPTKPTSGNGTTSKKKNDPLGIR